MIYISIIYKYNYNTLYIILDFQYYSKFGLDHMAHIYLAPSITFLAPGRRRKAKLYARGRRRAKTITFFNPPRCQKDNRGS